jgi:hypothetical protein
MERGETVGVALDGRLGQPSGVTTIAVHDKGDMARYGSQRENVEQQGCREPIQVVHQGDPHDE